MKIEQIYKVIAKKGFNALTLQLIDNYIKEIQHGTEDFPRFNLSEHAGGRPSSQATRQQALKQVAMLKAAKEAQQIGK